MKRNEKFVLWFNELGIEDVPLVGGKNASLGEMYRVLAPKGVKIPNGFALTAAAYRHFLEKTGLKARIRAELKGLNTKNRILGGERPQCEADGPQSPTPAGD